MKMFHSTLFAQGAQLALWCVGLFLMAGAGHAQIYVVNASGINGVDAYGFTGIRDNAISDQFYSTYAPQGITLVGSTLYVANMGTGSTTDGSITAYNLDGSWANSGTPYIVSDLMSAYAITGSGNTLYVSNFNSGTVSAYNATTGATVGGFATLTGLPNPAGLAVSGNRLFVSYVSTDGNGDRVAAFDATTGAALGGFTTIAGLSGPVGLAVSGGSLYVANQFSGVIGQYDIATGTAINDSFITGLDLPTGLAVSGNSLYVTLQGTGALGEFSLLSGLEINDSLITGLGQPYGIAVGGSAVPEPSTYAAIAGAAMLGFAAWRRRSVRAKAGN